MYWIENHFKKSTHVKYILKIYFKKLTNGEIIHISIKIILKNSHFE